MTTETSCACDGTATDSTMSAADLTALVTPENATLLSKVQDTGSSLMNAAISATQAAAAVPGMKAMAIVMLALFALYVLRPRVTNNYYGEHIAKVLPQFKKRR